MQYIYTELLHVNRAVLHFLRTTSLSIYYHIVINTSFMLYRVASGPKQIFYIIFNNFVRNSLQLIVQ